MNLQPGKENSNNWFCSQLPGAEQFIGWFDDSIEPLTADEYQAGPGSGKTGTGGQHEECQPADTPYSEIYNRIGFFDSF